MLEALSLDSQQTLRDMLSQAYRIETEQLDAVHGQWALCAAKKDAASSVSGNDTHLAGELSISDEFSLQSLAPHVSQDILSGGCEIHTGKVDTNVTHADGMKLDQDEHEREALPIPFSRG